VITLQQAMSHAIEQVEGEPPQVNAQNPDGQWPMTRTPAGYVISGAGNHTRYFVRDNEVTFSSFHATPEQTNKARAVGFTIE